MERDAPRVRLSAWCPAVCSVLLLSCLSARAASFDSRFLHSDALSNGLHIIVEEEPEATVVAVEMVVKAGAADERPEELGAAHLLEHVLWAGGGPDDPRTTIEEAGGVTNAGTLRDFTHYYATVPAGKGAADLVVGALAKMVLRDPLEESVVAREKGVIREEVAGRREALPVLLSDLAFETVYGKGHPYGRRLEGEPAVLEGLDARALEVFRRRWYVPTNMAVIVAGRATLAEVEEAVAGAFGTLPREPVPSVAPPAPSRPAKPQQVRIGIGGGDAYVMAAFVGPEMGEPQEVCATDALTILLSHVTYGRLHKRLLGAAPLVKDMGVDFLTQKGRALLGIWVKCEPAKVAEVQHAVEEELARLAAEPLSPQELAVVRRLTVAQYAFANETPTGRASTLAFYEALGSYREAAQYPQRVRVLRSQDLRNVASWYAVDPVWVVLSPKGKKP